MTEDTLSNAIAIVGMSGKFPGADNIQGFWENLCDGKETISFFSDNELFDAGLSQSQINIPGYVKSRGVLNGVELFDANFFGFTPKEAQLTDPQHRLFLECAWEALENAGYCPDDYPGLIGVYGGTGISSYYLNNIHPNWRLRETLGDFLIRIGNDKDFLTTRVSYKLNLKGPSVAVQTACSTSLVAVCIACNHLLTYQCDMALAGGVTISVPQTSGYIYQEGMIFSGDGHCRPFDSSAQGTVSSNGVGILILKRLQDAIADKDHIVSVIRGYGINNDGHEKMNYSAPSIKGQADAISQAISMADIDPETITYVEAHGTGTILGDPVEIQGLTDAFHSTKKQFCAIGSVKSNIGHAFEAAGAIGLIKTVLALMHKKIPPSLHFDKPNPHINFTETPFYVNTSLKDWEVTEHPRRACVSSFGIGGTNAHVILEEWTQEPDFEKLQFPYQLILSAKTPTALKTMAINLGQHLQKHTELSLANVAYTLQVGRQAFEHKRILVCSNREEAISLLLQFDPANFPAISDSQAADFRENNRYHRVPLPTYPFEKKRYWIDPITTSDELAPSVSPKYLSVESKIITIWKEVLGVEPTNIHDDFFKIGGDSLLAIEVASRLSKHFDVNLGMHTLFTYPTVAELSKIISEQTTIISPLIKLKEGVTGAPLFLIHPIEGALFCYKDLIDELKCDNPIYGIQAIESNEKSFEELASTYLSELCKIQPTGPYHLIGMSFGGIIAYEIARQLQANGESVALLCMLDAGNPNPFLLSLPDDKARLSYLVGMLEGKPILDTEITPEKIMQSLGLATIPSKDQEIIFKRIKIHLRILAEYQPKPYSGKILFFQASQRSSGNIDFCSGEGWKELVNGKIEIREIPGNHITMLKQPSVKTLATYINSYLQELI